MIEFPVFKATNIKWDVDADDVMDYIDNGYIDEISCDQDAEILGISRSIYGDMTDKERKEYICDAIANDKSIAAKLIGLPSEVEIPDNMITFDTDTDAISDFISDEIGFCHAGFEIECNMALPDLKREYHKLNEDKKRLESAMAFVASYVV